MTYLQRGTYVTLRSILKILAIFVFIIVSFKLIVYSDKNVAYSSMNDGVVPCNSTESLLRDFVNKIQSVSPEQKLIPTEVILKTLDFMIDNVAEDDENLIEYVRSIMRKPSNGPLSLREKNRVDHSQFGTSEFIDNLLDKRTNGTFLEVGGFDGEFQSNTLFFEIARSWKGILIEPLPSLYKKLVTKKRNVYSINACVAKSKPFIAKFLVNGPYSGIEHMMQYQLKEALFRAARTRVPNYAYVPCFPLYTILRAANILKIDYFSLDVQGGEYSILESIPFDKVDIEAFSIEYVNSTREKIITKLQNHGYKFQKETRQDLYFNKI